MLRTLGELLNKLYNWTSPPRPPWGQRKVAAVERCKQESMYYGLFTKKMAVVLREVAVSGCSFDCSIIIRSLQVDLSDYGVHGWHLNLFALIMYKETFLFLSTFLKFCSFLTFFRKVWFVCISLPICGLGGGFSFVPIMPDLVRSARWVLFITFLQGSWKKASKVEESVISRAEGRGW